MISRGSAVAKASGYTLIEVILFLAISGSLTAIALIGLGSRLSNVRFTDATKTIQSDITREITDSQVGVSRNDDELLCRFQTYYLSNPNGQPEIVSDPASTSGSSQACVINGKLAFIMQDKIEYHSLVSLRNPTPNIECKQPADDFEQIVKCYRPRIPRGAIPAESSLVQTISHKNGLKASVFAGTEFPIGFGYIQNPNSSSKYFFWFKPDASDDNGIFRTQFVNSDNMSIDPQPQNSWPITSEKKVCLTLSSREAQLVFSPGAVKPTIKPEGCN